MPLAFDSDAWFTTEVLPHEKALTRLLSRHIHDHAEVKDLRQDVYVRLYEAAKHGSPPTGNLGPLINTVARNLLIDRSRRAKVISIDFVFDWAENLQQADTLTPERYASDREALRHFEEGVRSLPQRCRQAITLRKIDGLTQRECAQRMGISEGTLEAQVQKGMRFLTDFMLGGVDRNSERRTRRRKVFQK